MLAAQRRRPALRFRLTGALERTLSSALTLCRALAGKDECSSAVKSRSAEGRDPPVHTNARPPATMTSPARSVGSSNTGPLVTAPDGLRQEHPGEVSLRNASAPASLR